MHISFTTSTYFQNRIKPARKPIVQPNMIAKHSQPVFSGDSRHSEEVSGWWQHFSQIISSFLGTAPAKKSPYKLRMDDPLPDGTLISSAVRYKWAEGSRSRITPENILLMSPMAMVAIELNRSKDKTLMAYLNSDTLAQLKKDVPSAAASENEEVAFLHRLNKYTNQQFDHAGLSWHDQNEISKKDYYLHYYDKLAKYNQQDEPSGERPTRRSSRLLGHSMQKGVGVCRHRALLNFLSIRQMKVPGLTATYIMGLQKELLARDSDFSLHSAHAYNVVTMPSGRKYVVDPFSDPLNDSTGLVLPKKKIGGHKHPLNYVSFDHILKYGNPNENKPVFRTEKQDEFLSQTTWLVRPSLTRNNSRQTI